jgi:hypothetical protein
MHADDHQWELGKFGRMVGTKQTSSFHVVDVADPSTQRPDILEHEGPNEHSAKLAAPSWRDRVVAGVGKSFQQM